MIRPVAVCVFRNNGRILVCQASDTVKKDLYARPLGGKIETGEYSKDAILREIREEIDQEITDLKLLGVLENIFVCDGQPRQEIMFVYDAKLVDQSLYEREGIKMNEAGWSPMATWHSLDSFGKTCRLVPEGLMDLLLANND